MNDRDDPTVEETIRFLADDTEPTNLEKEAVRASLRRAMSAEEIEGIQRRRGYRPRRLVAIVGFGALSALIGVAAFLSLDRGNDGVSEALGRLAADIPGEGGELVLYRTVGVFAADPASRATPGDLSDGNLLEEREIWTDASGKVFQRVVQQMPQPSMETYQPTLSLIGVEMLGGVLGLVETKSVLDGLEIPVGDVPLADGLGSAIEMTAQREGIDPVILILQLIRDVGVMGDLRSAAIVSLEAHNVRLIETMQDGSVEFEHVLADGSLHRFVLSAEGQISSESVSGGEEAESAGRPGGSPQVVLVYSLPVLVEDVGVAG